MSRTSCEPVRFQSRNYVQEKKKRIAHRAGKKWVNSHEIKGYFLHVSIQFVNNIARLRKDTFLFES